MQTYTLTGAAGSNLDDVNWNVADDYTLYITRGATITGALGSINAYYGPPTGRSLTIRPTGAGTNAARIYTRNGFRCDGTAATLDVEGVTVEQNITGSNGSNYDRNQIGLKTTGDAGVLAATLRCVNCVVKNWLQSIKPAGDNTYVYGNTLVDPYTGYVQVGGAATDGQTPKDGYIGYNICTSTRFAAARSAAGDGISVHDGKSGDFGGTGWIVEWNDVDMDDAKENAYDCQTWFTGAIFRFNIARNSRQYAFTFGDGGGTGAPPGGDSRRTQIYGNSTIGCPGGFNIEQNADVYANLALDCNIVSTDGTSRYPVRVNVADRDITIAFNQLVAANTASTSPGSGVVAISGASNTPTVRVYNNILVHSGTSNVPLYHAQNPSFVFDEVSHNRLVPLFNANGISRFGNGSSLENLAAWQGRGNDVAGTTQLDSAGYTALLLNGYTPPDAGSPLIASGIWVDGCEVDALGLARVNPPTIGPWELTVAAVGGLRTRTPLMMSRLRLA